MLVEYDGHAIAQLLLQIIRQEGLESQKIYWIAIVLDAFLLVLLTARHH